MYVQALQPSQSRTVALLGGAPVLCMQCALTVAVTGAGLHFFVRRWWLAHTPLSAPVGAATAGSCCTHLFADSTVTVAAPPSSSSHTNILSRLRLLPLRLLFCDLGRFVLSGDIGGAAGSTANGEDADLQQRYSRV